MGIYCTFLVKYTVKWAILCNQIIGCTNDERMIQQSELKATQKFRLHAM